MSETTDATSAKKTIRVRLMEAAGSAVREPIAITRAAQEEWLRAMDVEPMSTREFAAEYVKLTRATFSYQFELMNEGRKLTAEMMRALVRPLRRAKPDA